MTAAIRLSCSSARVSTTRASAARAACRRCPEHDFKTGDFSNFLDAAGAQIPIFDPSDHATGRSRQLCPHAVSRKRHPGQPDQPRLGQDRGATAEPGSSDAQTNNWYNRTGAFPSFNTFTSTAKLDHSVSTKQKISVTYSEPVATPADQQQRLGNFRQQGSRAARRAGRTGRLPTPDRDQPDLAPEPRLHFQRPGAQPLHRGRRPVREPVQQYQCGQGVGPGARHHGHAGRSGRVPADHALAAAPARPSPWACPAMAWARRPATPSARA